MRHKKLLRVVIIGIAMASLLTACPELEDKNDLKTPPKEEAEEKEDPKPAGEKEKVGGDKDAEEKAEEEAGAEKEAEEKEAPKPLSEKAEEAKVGGDKDEEEEKAEEAEEKDASSDTTPPTITGAPVIKSTPKSSETYKTGEVIQVAVMFSEKVNVDTNGNNGNIYINLRIGKLVRARYESGSSTDTLIFEYTVKSGDKSDPRGINIRKDALTIRPESGASIKDTAGNLANLKHKSMKLQAKHKVDAEEKDAEKKDKVKAKEAGDGAGEAKAEEEAGAEKEAEEKEAPKPLSEKAEEAKVGGEKDAEEEKAEEVEEKEAASDTTPPTITGAPVIKSTPKSSETYKTGEVIQVAVMFSEKVNVNTNGDDKNIYINLRIGNRTVKASYESGSSTDTLIFAYTVKSGNKSSKGIRISSNALRISPGSGTGIKDEAGNDADLKHKALETDSNHKVDAEPTVKSVALMGEGKTYNTKDVIKIAVTFSEKVNVNTDGDDKNIYINLRIGKLVRARYESGSSTDTLIFEYTVKSGDKSSKGIRISSNALTIRTNSGASIKDEAGNPAKMKHKSMNLQAKHKVDAEPSVTEVKIESTPKSDNTYKVGETILVAVTFSEKVKVPDYRKHKKNKNIYVELLIGETTVQAIYKRGSSSRTLTFAYKVNLGDTAPAGISIPKDALTIRPGSGASIKDNAKKDDAKLGHAALGKQEKHKVDGS